MPTWSRVPAGTRTSSSHLELDLAGGERMARHEHVEALLRQAGARLVEVVELLTLVLGPNALLVAARIDLADGMRADRVEQLAGELDDAVRAAVPDVTEVFLDATAARQSA
jgi:hypothetical protein